MMNYKEFISEDYKPGYKTKEDYDADYDLFQRAKEAYYNGDSILGDNEYDELEKKLGLENQSYIGTHHSENYKIQHEILMGTLSKVQVKNNSSDGTVHYSDYIDAINKYFGDVPDSGIIEVTPKFDGCSWEAVYDDIGNLLSVSTRGDGEYGKDVKPWIENSLTKLPVKQCLKNGYKLIIRGEALADFKSFDAKHSSEFANTRSYVAGMFGQDWEGNKEQLSNREDISIVAYDFRLSNKKGTYEWVDYNKIKGYDNVLGYNFITFKKGDFNKEKLAEIYAALDELRSSYKFPLDGFVLKPEIQYRKTENIARPKDCVAIKFLPKMLETTIEHIEWNVGKTHELYPKAIFSPIKLDGKNITKASLHNYGFVIDNKVGIGSKIKISLAGDIIPFVYEVISNGNNNEAPQKDVTVKGPHLMLDMSDADKKLVRIQAGADALNIKGVKDATLEKIIPEFIANNGPELNTVLDLMKDESINFIKTLFGNTISTKNIVTSLTERRNSLTLEEIVLAMQYRLCGKRISKIVGEYLRGEIVVDDMVGVSGEVKEWVTDKTSKNYNEIKSYVDYFNVNISARKQDSNDIKIPIIMTGSPSNYKTKADFLKAHPEYVDTTNWKEAKILFTGDMNSNSAKMVRAQKIGLEIKEY